jgi:peptide/nickel transport system substrate-binding protein
MIKSFLAAALALLMAMGSAEAQRREIRVGFSQDALTLDPANHRSRETQTIIRTMYDGLFARNARMEVVPELVDAWRQIDPVTYELTIHRGVRFHSGDELTAEDVKYTFDRLTRPNAMGGQTSPRQSLLGPFKEVRVTGSHTVQFILETPWPILVAMLPFQEVVSRAFTERVGTAGMATQVNGTGPFRLVEWRRGEALIMERFADYFGGARSVPPVGPAQVDRVIYRIIPENAARVAALLAGEVELINELPVSAIRQVESNPNTRVVRVNGTRTFFVAFNLAKAPFTDVRVRRALNHAVDRNLIVQRVLAGTATVLNGVLSPDAFAFNASLPEHRYDPELARRLLAEAGLGQGFELTIDTQGAFREPAEALASMLTRVGVRARVQVWEGSVLTPMWQTAERRRERDMYFTSWGNGSLDPSDIMVPTLMTGARGNTSGFSNPEVDQLLQAAEIEINQDRRRAMYLRAQEIVNREAPWVFLWLPQDIYGASRRLAGWEPSADSRINLHDATLR